MQDVPEQHDAHPAVDRAGRRRLLCVLHEPHDLQEPPSEAPPLVGEPSDAGRADDLPDATQHRHDQERSEHLPDNAHHVGVWGDPRVAVERRLSVRLLRHHDVVDLPF